MDDLIYVIGTGSSGDVEEEDGEMFISIKFTLMEDVLAKHCSCFCCEPPAVFWKNISIVCCKNNEK